jgi:membrane protein DedA with SNARE-associated domain
MPNDLAAPLLHHIVAFMSATGYAGLAVLMALESACAPVPSEIVLPFAGFLVSQGRMNLWLVATVGALACNLGSLAAYELGRHGGRRAVERWGRYLLITPRDLDRADRLFARFGGLTVFVARMLPFVRTYVAVPAGIAAMPRLRFHLYTFAGSWGWCLLLAYVGAVLGDRWISDPRLHRIFHRIDLAVAAVVVATLAVFVWRRLRALRRGSASAGYGSPQG